MEYKREEKVIYIPEGKVYDFAYYSASEGRCIIYEEGCCNMQDGCAVSLDNIRRLSGEEKSRISRS